MSKCKQCGKCCHRGDFWQTSEHPFLQALAQQFRQEGFNMTENGMCLMLSQGNECLIEKHFGVKYKPKVCREYFCEIEEKNVVI